MKMFEIGRVAIKLAGRDAGQKCVIVDVLEGKYVVIDGMTRRRKCNMLHLEPMDQILDIEKGASHEEIVRIFKTLGHDVKTPITKAKTTKPLAIRNVKVKSAKTQKVKKEKKSEAKS
ncbi:MAG: 50S ribosomal protein L14e [Candidatus Woesearchaeota archaeon]